jgi:hypothetical protein
MVMVLSVIDSALERLRRIERIEAIVGVVMDLSAIDSALERLRRIEGLAEEGAPEVARATTQEVHQNIRAQRDPWHKPWKPGKEGRPVLVNAAAHVKVIADGTVILATVDGVESLHHIGKARGYHGGSGALGGFRRNLMPTGGIVPGPLRTVTYEALRRTVVRIRDGK